MSFVHKLGSDLPFQSMSSLGHDRTCNHEHHGSEELHDFPKDEEENPVSCYRVHLGKDRVA